MWAIQTLGRRSSNSSDDENPDIASIPELIEIISDTAPGSDLVDQVKDVITAGEFYEKPAGGEIAFRGSGPKAKHDVAHSHMGAGARWSR